MLGKERVNLLANKELKFSLYLEYCDMGYLRDYVLNTKNQIDRPDLAMQIANGMRYLHYGAPFHPIIHRNLHPLSGK